MLVIAVPCSVICPAIDVWCPHLITTCQIFLIVFGAMLITLRGAPTVRQLPGRMSGWPEVVDRNGQLLGRLGYACLLPDMVP